MSRENEKLNIVYIVSAGHSGSTLLDLVLTSDPSVFSVGELKSLERFILSKYDPRIHKNLTPDDDSGSTIFDSIFWSSIVAEADNFLVPENNKIMWSKIDRIRVMLFGYSAKVPVYYNYKVLYSYIHSKYQKLSNLSDVTVVDASKNIGHLAQLLNTPEINVHVIYLVRDIRGYVYSTYRRKGLIGSFFAVWEWVRINWQIVNYLNKNKLYKSFTKIRYEDFCKNTQSNFYKINKAIGLNLDYINYVKNIKVKDSYRFAGNAGTKKDFDGLMFDNKWSEAMPKVVSIALAPINKLFS
jgi:hypothetical protein